MTLAPTADPTDGQPGLLAGRVVVITGAGPGVGASLAQTASREGAAIVVGARDAARLDLIVSAVENAGGRALAIPVDVTDPASCAALAEGAIQAFGRIDALVNAAFWTEPEQRLWELDDDTFGRAFDVNVGGTWRVIRAVEPHLTRPGGAIVTIGSQAGTKSSATLAAYAAAKAAVHSLTGSAAVQLGPAGIRVNGVLPGSIDGPGLLEWAEERGGRLGTSTEDELALRRSRSPLGRIVTPDEIAEAAVFLCSDRASGITGTLVDLDCGQHLNA